jgi:hypothetical protein
MPITRQDEHETIKSGGLPPFNQALKAEFRHWLTPHKVGMRCRGKRGAMSAIQTGMAEGYETAERQALKAYSHN